MSERIFSSDKTAWTERSLAVPRVRIHFAPPTSHCEPMPWWLAGVNYLGRDLERNPGAPRRVHGAGPDRLVGSGALRADSPTVAGRSRTFSFGASRIARRAPRLPRSQLECGSAMATLRRSAMPSGASRDRWTRSARSSTRWSACEALLADDHLVLSAMPFAQQNCSPFESWSRYHLDRPALTRRVGLNSGASVGLEVLGFLCRGCRGRS